MYMPVAAGRGRWWWQYPAVRQSWLHAGTLWARQALQFRICWL